MSAQLRNFFIISHSSHMKKWEFLEYIKASILILKFEPILNKLEKSETVGAHSLAALSEQRRPPVLTAFRPRLPPLCRAPVSPLPPPRPQLTPPLPTASTSYKRSTPSVERRFYLLRPLRCHFAAVLTVIEPLWTAAPVPLRTPPTLLRAPHRRRELHRPPCRHPRLLLRPLTVAHPPPEYFTTAGLLGEPPIAA
jgi:hypothetical protein